MNHLLLICAFASVLAAGCTADTTKTAVPTSSSSTTSSSTTTSYAVSTTTTIGVTTTTEALDLEAPMIETSPQSGETIDWFRGDFLIATEPGASLTIDAEQVELANDGTYAYPVTNTPGNNVVYVTAKDQAGNLATERVWYEFVTDEAWIAAIGDSIMLGSKAEIEMRLGDKIVDATVSRQFLNAPKLVAQLLARGHPPQVIIVGLGTNGPVQERHFEEVMEIVGTETLVAFINVHVPRKWEATSNRELAAGVERHDNAVLVDWYSATEGRNNLFAGDGFHPKQAGRVIMAELIASTIYPEGGTRAGE
jgi:hypothetical protein